MSKIKNCEKLIPKHTWYLYFEWKKANIRCLLCVLKAVGFSVHDFSLRNVISQLEKGWNLMYCMSISKKFLIFNKFLAPIAQWANWWLQWANGELRRAEWVPQKAIRGSNEPNWGSNGPNKGPNEQNGGSNGPNRNSNRLNRGTKGPTLDYNGST